MSKLYDVDGKCLKITNKIVSKMGPVQLNLEHQNLYQAWDQSRRSEIEGFQGLTDMQSYRTETWVCRPPNVLLFQLNRVDYDLKAKKLVKNNQRFEFDKTIFLDLFLNQNKERANKHVEELDQMREDLKLLKESYKKYMEGDQGHQINEVLTQTHRLLAELGDKGS